MSVLNAHHITKVFPGTVALDDVSMSFESGKVNALVGKNGSGKSTLVKIINGAHFMNGGSMDIDGVPFSYASPKQSSEAGIATVYQEMSLIPGLSVAENILVGRYKTRGPFVDWKAIFAEGETVLARLGISLPVRELVQNLSVWQMQIVEIAKAMSLNPRVILLDEPTSALAQHETELLFRMIREMTSHDVIIIYISHRLQELWKIADTCSVLRDGKFVGKLDMGTATHEQLLNYMFGDTKVRERPADIVPSMETVLEVAGITREPAFRDISFQLHKGEILGVAGMLGAGRTELLRGIFGADTLDRGTFSVKGEIIRTPSPLSMRKNGVAFLPEDRKEQGSIQILSIRENLMHACLSTIAHGGSFIDHKYEERLTRKQIEDLAIHLSDPENALKSLSGGNQQKVVLGKWLNTEPQVLLFDELSRGIDVNAKQQIFQILWDLARDGLSSIVVSSELEELLEICNRILIMRDGEIIDEVTPDGLSVEGLYSMCMGGSES
jgi:ribose transport system ATP-binding protein